MSAGFSAPPKIYGALAIASNLDFRGILFTVVQRIAEVAEVDRVSIVLVREGNVGYVVAASDDRTIENFEPGTVAAEEQKPPGTIICFALKLFVAVGSKCLLVVSK